MFTAFEGCMHSAETSLKKKKSHTGKSDLLFTCHLRERERERERGGGGREIKKKKERKRMNCESGNDNCRITGSKQNT